jgi:hypothetical protein
MATARCDGCGESVPVAGGPSDLWTLEGDQSGGVTLELADGSEPFLCFGCLERLPDDETITADHVDALDADGS